MITAKSGASIAQKKWIRVIHVAKRECGIDDEAYRALLYGAARTESAGGIKMWRQFDTVMDAFKNLGFRPQSKTGRASGLKETDTETKRNPAWITAPQEYYIRGLWDLASRKKDAESLRKMVYRIGGVDDIRFLKKGNTQKVILALRDIAEKAGFAPDGPEKEG
jgi:hypothetical protein